MLGLEEPDPSITRIAAKDFVSSKCQPLIGVKDGYMNSRSWFRKGVNSEEKELSTDGVPAWGLMFWCIILFSSYNNSLR